MIPKVDYGNLYKFVASLGLLLIIASLAIPWFITQSAPLLLVPEAKLGGLTEVASNAIRDRQALLASILPVAWPWASILLLVLGIGLVVWALKRWKKSQDRQDASEVLSLDKSKAEFEKLTPTEQEEKLSDEVKESLEEESNNNENIPLPGLENSESLRKQSFNKRRELIKNCEDKIHTLLVQSYSDSFTVERDVRTTSEKSRRYVLDFALEPSSSPWAQLGVDVKVIAPRFGLIRLMETLVRLAITTRGFASGAVYTNLREPPRPALISGILILIVDDTEEEEFSPALRERVIDETNITNSVLKQQVGTLILRASEIGDLEATSFQSKITKVWCGF